MLINVGPGSYVDPGEVTMVTQEENGMAQGQTDTILVLRSGQRMRVQSANADEVVSLLRQGSTVTRMFEIRQALLSRVRAAQDNARKMGGLDAALDSAITALRQFDEK